ncbi:MAG: rod shape-determining protein MreD [Pyrinomonadaceae bacterium]|nr:rod shape-determining protein MreD [Pyrinomonadaceae bacterium]
MNLKLAVCILLAVVLQSSLPTLSRSLVYIDLPLILVVYVALKRNAVQSVFVGAVTGIATDAMSNGLLGANGFSKTLTAYLIAALATRVALDNYLIRIFVLASAVLFDSTVYYILHVILNQMSRAAFVETVAWKLIATTVVGTFVFYVFDIFFSDRTSQSRQFAFRRRAARRSLTRRSPARRKY